MNAPTSITNLLPQSSAAAADAGRVLRREGTRIACPHCGTPSQLKDMTRESALEWRAIYGCDNYECGHTFATRIVLVRRLKMSATPNPDIELPMSTHARELSDEAQQPESGDLFVGVDLDQFNVMPAGVLGLRFPRRLAKRASDTGERVACPDCGSDACIRTSWKMADLLRETTYHCTNGACCGVFVAHKEITETLSPSATPNPAVRLPLAPHVRRALLIALLDAADVGNYQPQHTAPVTGDLFAGASPPT